MSLRVSSFFCGSGRGYLSWPASTLGHDQQLRCFSASSAKPGRPGLSGRVGWVSGCDFPAGSWPQGRRVPACRGWEGGSGRRAPAFIKRPGPRGAGRAQPPPSWRPPPAGTSERRREGSKDRGRGDVLPERPAHPGSRARPALRRDVRRVSQEPSEGHEIININLKNKPEWFFTKNPFGLVPVLENSQGQLIYESAITCEYLDEAYPGKKLLPDDPYEKACQKMVFQLFSKVPPLVTSFIRRQNNEDGSGLKEELRKEFSKLEEVLTNKKTTFFGGNSLSMIDYLIWPWFERLEVLELNECVDHTPKLKLWMAAMREDPAVSSLLIEAKAFRGFLDLYLQNSPEACDYGL
ncbi:glutathione S-transferase omega-1 isoform X1 [Felis catus]|uniref:Glutathione-dependent dehydroascorbate reductase n=2 Tax=Felis catus TaxID=9685 RepID=A0ABI7VZF3_FELCA|nr:glutathione S-transferase omega-1 isoform X1 [Felis catus]